MKFAIVLFAIVGVSLGCRTQQERELFNEYLVEYGKSYPNQQEYLRRCNIFTQNYNVIVTHNMLVSSETRNPDAPTYLMGTNIFTDLTEEERMAYTGLNVDALSLDRTNKKIIYANENIKALPAEIDYSKEGVVTSVKNQGACGSCWAFASIANIESRYLFLTRNGLINLDLSEQQLVECQDGSGNQRCQGGLMTNVYKHLAANGQTINFESTYPYISGDGNNGSLVCRYNSSQDSPKIRVYDHVVVDKKDSALITAIANYGPVAVGIKVQTSFQNYKSGIYNPGLLCILPNHAVLVVGYTDKYWIIKNSWGTNWGENGYIRMSRTSENACDINRMASFPLIIY